MNQLNIGIMGTGYIAHKMAETARGMNSAVIAAVASRDAAKAEAFAKEFGIAKSYTSQEALVNDDSIDLIYVCSPHPYHYQNAKLALQAGRAVLCEKPFAMNRRQAQELIDLARQKNLFIMEAVWTRFLPMADTIHRLAHSGIIGKPMAVHAGFGFHSVGIPRMAQRELGGGALLDLGVYPINLAAIVFGPDATLGGDDVILWETGVDAVNAFVLHYGQYQSATLQSSMLNPITDIWHVYGETGRIEIKGISNFEYVAVFDAEGREIERHLPPPQGTGYEYQLEACRQALAEGHIECLEMPHSETLRIARLMDDLLARWGVTYPEV